MNDSGKISSVHGVLHQYHPGGLIEVAPVGETAGTGSGTGMSYYPDHFPPSTQVPRTMRLDEHQSTQGPRPLSVQTNSRGWGLGSGSGDSKLRPVEEDGGVGIGPQSSFETQLPQVNNGPSLMSPSRLNRSKTVSGQKRNAFGDVKQSTTEDTVAPLAPAANGVSRHRSRSIGGSTGHESRIAAVNICLVLTPLIYGLVSNGVNLAVYATSQSSLSRCGQSRTTTLFTRLTKQKPFAVCTGGSFW